MSQSDNQFMLLKNLVYMFYLTNPAISAARMYIIWDQNKVLKEYPRPELPILKELIEELNFESVSGDFR
jgi:hypothetical protein